MSSLHAFKAILLAVSLSLAGGIVHAAEQEHHGDKVAPVATLNNLAIGQPWSRALPPTVQTGAAYVSIANLGKTADRLTGAASSAADKVELHAHLLQGDLLRMVAVDSIEVPAKGMLELAPGGYHIMLIGLKQPLREGERFPIRLEFEKAGALELEVEIRSPDAGTAAEHLHH